MLLIRRFEEKAAQSYGMGQIAGFCHLYIGQEAVVVGIQKALKKEDMVVTSYRDHGHIIVAGMDPKYVMAELMGKATGCSKGKGGSMHVFDTSNHFYGGHGIVGAQVPIGTGLAFAAKYKKTDAISVTYYGDGAAHQGQIYEAFNMASMWKLPALYIIENNEYGMGTSVKRHSCQEDLYKFSESFNIPSKQIDGMDVMNVYREAKEYIDYVRAGKGPALIEVKTYRYRGHSMSDPGNYRSKEEVNLYKDSKDPIQNFKNYLIAQKLATEDSLKQIENEIKLQMKEVMEFCENSPLPDTGELYTNIYKGE